jgi:putative endonuclease
LHARLCAGAAALRCRWRALLVRHAPRAALFVFEPTPHELGRIGEGLAARRLVRAGLVLVARNSRTAGAEIDVLACEGDVLVAVEVKTSRSHPERRLGERRFRPQDRVDHARERRLALAARALGRSAGRRVRVDVVEVWVHGPRRRVEIAWTPGT